MSFVNRSSSRFILIIIFIALAACVAYVYRPQSSHQVDVKNLPSTYYDESIDKFWTSTPERVPPERGYQYREGDEPAIYRAVMSGSTLSIENARYFFRFTPEVQKQLLASVKDPKDPAFDTVQMNTMHGKEVRLPQPGSPWVSAESPEGQKIMNR